MKTLTIILAVLVPALWHCTDAPVPAPNGDSPALAGLAGFTVSEEAMPPDTGQLIARRVWAGPDVGTLGQPTPDGRYLTFVDWSAGGEVGVRDLRTGEVRHITDMKAQDPMGAYADLSIVSPDGERVAYHWYPGNWVFELHVVDLDGRNRKILVQDKEVTWASPRDWTADGSQLLVTMEKGDQTQLVFISVEDGSQRLLRTLDRRTYNARLSPDGRFVVYDQPVAGTANTRNIFIVSSEGGDARPLVESSADDQLLGWVPDTDYVLFSSDRGGTLGAWILPVANGSAAGPPELVRPDLWRAWPMGFAADGSFFYGVKVSTKTIDLVTIDPETATVLGDPSTVDARNLGNIARPAWSADGRYMSYLSGEFRSGPRIVIRSMETGETRELDPRLRTGSPALWSPDGRQLLLVARDLSDQEGLFRVDVQTGEVSPLRILEPGQAVFAARWAPDGKTVYYKVDFDRESHLVALDVESGAQRILRSANKPTWISISWGLSPDGEHIGYWQRDWSDDTRALRLLVIPTSGTVEPARELVKLEFPRQAQMPAGGVWWTDDGQSLLYIMASGEGEDRKAEFWKVPVDGGEPVLTELKLAGLSGGLPQFSPDGRQVAFEAGKSAWEVWVMKNYLPDK